MFAHGCVVIAQGGLERFIFQRTQTGERVQGVDAGLRADLCAKQVGSHGSKRLVAHGILAVEQQPLGLVALPAVG